MENIKILLVKYLLSDFNNALVTLYQECSSNPDLSKNMAAGCVCVGGGGGGCGEWGRAIKFIHKS